MITLDEGETVANRTQELIDDSAATAPPIDALSVRIPVALKERFTSACKALGIERNKAAAAAISDSTSILEAEIKTRSSGAVPAP